MGPDPSAPSMCRARAADGWRRLSDDSLPVNKCQLFLVRGCGTTTGASAGTRHERTIPRLFQDHLHTCKGLIPLASKQYHCLGIQRLVATISKQTFVIMRAGRAVLSLVWLATVASHVASFPVGDGEWAVLFASLCAEAQFRCCSAPRFRPRLRPRLTVSTSRKSNERNLTLAPA